MTADATVAAEILAGVALALVLVGVARGSARTGPNGVYAVGLLVTAAIYVAFALVGRASPRWVAIEGLGVALFGGLAWLGRRRWPAALALGWAAHVAWDVGLHLDGAGGAFTPAWYPWLCVGFDLVIAGAVLAGRHRGGRPPNRGRAGQ